MHRLLIALYRSAAQVLEEVVERGGEPLEPALHVELLEERLADVRVRDDARGHLVAERDRRADRLERLAHLVVGTAERLAGSAGTARVSSVPGRSGPAGLHPPRSSGRAITIR